MEKIFHWAPRILSILFVIFLSIFSLDVFSEYHGFSLLIPLFIHLLIPLALLLAAIAAWKWDLVGAVTFFAFAVYYVWMVGFGRNWSWYAFISGPALLTGTLFLLSWLAERREKT